MPPGLPNIIQSFNNVIATMTNPFSPLLIADLILDTFTTIIFVVDKRIWVWVPALLLWIFTSAMYFYFAKHKPHMLSTTVIQKYGMRLEAELGEKGKKPLTAEAALEILPTTDPAINRLKEGK